jgi:hypothetical protein
VSTVPAAPRQDPQTPFDSRSTPRRKRRTCTTTHSVGSQLVPHRRCLHLGVGGLVRRSYSIALRSARVRLPAVVTGSETSLPFGSRVCLVGVTSQTGLETSSGRDDGLRSAAVSPVPIVRAQAVIVAVLFVAAAVLGAPSEVSAIAGAVGLAGMALRWKYRSDMRRSAGILPPHRDRLDLLVSGDLRASVLLGLAIALTLILGGVDPPDGMGAARSVVLTLLSVASCIYLSSLVDGT